MYNDLYLLFFLILMNIYQYVNQKILDHFNIPVLIIYEHISASEGSANAIPRRVMVSEKDCVQVVKILENAQSVSDG